jgi:hypothetical protein
MSTSKSSGTQNKQSARDSEEEVARKRSGADKSANTSADKSADEKSRTRAGTGKGAGGGAKQKQGH